MAASRMSRIAGGRRLPLWLLLAALASLASVVADLSSTAESIEDAELITVPRNGNEYVGFSVADGEAGVGGSPHDLKKHTSNKKFQKFYPKTEADWNFKGEIKKGDVFIKDAKDNRLLRLITEGLIGPQDTLPIVSNDAITSSQKNVSNGEMSVTVHPEGMSGVVDEGLAADSDEKIIMEKKKNATQEWTPVSLDDTSRESDENVKINLDGNAGVQSPVFNRQKGSIAVPAQKQISLSKGTETAAHNKLADAGYEVISLNKQKDKSSSVDEGVFDFVDSPLSNKNLVPAGTAQTSRVNVKKGPNGQDYEYEYIYYYYEDPDDATNQNVEKSRKGNDITANTATPTGRTTTPGTRNTFTSTTRYTKPFPEDGLGTRIKSTDVLNEPALSQSPSGRDRNRPDFRYTVDNSAVPSASPTVPNKHVSANDEYWQYDNSNNNRLPGRQVHPQAVSERTVTIPDETVPTTRQPSRGRVHFNSATTEDDSSFIVTAQPISTQPPRDLQTRSKSTNGLIRQPGLELVDSNSFRTHSTNIPSDYDKVYSPTQAFESPRGKSLKQTQQESTLSQNMVPSVSTNDEIFRKDATVEYATGTERLLTTTPTRGASSLSTETVLDNTAPFSTLSENTLTTVYGPGLTDKAAHDLYAIYQQTQNEETVRNTISQDDRTTAVDEPGSSFTFTNPPTTSLFTTTTTTTTTTTPAPTTTTTTAAPVPSLPGRGRFRGNVGTRTRHSTSTTEGNAAALPADANETSERPRSKFRPSHHREPGQRVSAYGRRGHTSTTTSSADGEAASSTASTSDSVRSSYSVTPRSRYRGGASLRSENANTEGQQPSSTPSQHKFNFADRYNSRRRTGSRTSTTAAPATGSGDEEAVSKSDTSSSVDTSVSEPQQSTTFRSIRNKLNPSSQVRPLRPGPKINFSSRGRHGLTSSTSTVAAPLDADTSGSADVPVEQRHTEEHSEHETDEAAGESGPSSTPLTTASTAQPDALTRLRNRPKLRISDKGGHAKAQAQQSNFSATVNQNRRQLVNNLLPRKKQPSTSTETQEPTEEHSDISPRPVTEEVVEEAQAASKADVDVSEPQPAAEASSTTESRLSSLIASRRRNLARKPGTLVHSSRQTANEETSS